MTTEVFYLFYLMSLSLEVSVAGQQCDISACCKKGLPKCFLFSAFTKKLSVNSECEWIRQQQNKSCMCEISISSLKIHNNSSFPLKVKKDTVITTTKKNKYAIMLHFLHFSVLIFTSQHRSDTAGWPGCTWLSAVPVTAGVKLELSETGSVQIFVGTETWNWNSKQFMPQTVESRVPWCAAKRTKEENVPHLTTVLLLTAKFSSQK